MKRSLPHFALLILVAVIIWAKLHYLAVLILALVLFFRGYWFLAERYPRTP